MNFKLINYGDCNIIKINEEAFLFIRKSGINISVRSDRELNFTKEEYQYYNELFRKQPTLNKVDFPSKLIRFNKDEELWIFNLAETSSYSICIDEHQDIWKYDYKKEGWIKLYEIGAKGHLKSLLKIQKYTTNSVIEEYFGGCKNNQPFINSNINYPLRFKLLRNTKYINYYKLINNTGECLYLKPDKYGKIMPLYSDGGIEGEWINQYNPSGVFTIKIGDKELVAQELIRTNSDLVYLAEDGSLWKIQNFNNPKIVYCFVEFTGKFELSINRTLGVIEYKTPITYKTTKIVKPYGSDYYALVTATNEIVLLAIDDDNKLLLITQDIINNYNTNIKSVYNNIKNGKYEKENTFNSFDYQIVNENSIQLTFVYDNNGLDNRLYESLMISPNGDLYLYTKDRVTYNDDIQLIYKLTPNGYHKINQIKHLNVMPNKKVVIKTNDIFYERALFINDVFKLLSISRDGGGLLNINNNNYYMLKDSIKLLTDNYRFIKDLQETTAKFEPLDINGEIKYVYLVNHDAITNEILEHNEDLFITSDLQLYLRKEYMGYTKWDNIEM